MPFQIPNAADAEDGSQAQIDSRDFRDILVAAFSGTGVISGCAVTAQAGPNMTVAVASGQVAVQGAPVSVTGGNVTITTANATNPRFDLICVDSGGVKSAVAGSPSATPFFPDPAGKAVLAAVRVPAGAIAINGAKIVDKRVAPVITPSAFPVGFVGQFAGTLAPAGWWLCDGSAISRTTYAVLFALVGTTYGPGDGSTTFNVPDIAGRVISGPGANVDVNAVGKNDGLPSSSRSPIHNSTNGIILPDHVHSVNDPGHNHNINDPGHFHADVVYDAMAPGANARMGNNGTGGTNPAPFGNTVAVTGITIVSKVTGITVANPTTHPVAGGSIGPGGTRPVDTPGFIVLNHMIRIL